MKKYSKQRELILDSLKNRKDHPTAEKLFIDLKKQMPELGIATVYRNLNELCNEQNIVRLKTKTGPDRYDGNILPHIHLECKKCGEIIDICLNSEDIDKIHKDIEKISNEAEVNLDSAEIYINGLCKSCK